MKIRNLRLMSHGLALAVILIISQLFSSCSRQLTSLQKTGGLQAEQVMNNVKTTPEAAILAQTNPVALPDICTPVIKKDNELAKNEEPAVATHPKQFARTNHLIAKSKMINQELVKTIDKQFASVSSTFKNNNVLGHQHASLFHRALYFIFIGVIFCIC